MEKQISFKGVVFYPEDFLFAVRRWQDEEIGEYIRLLCEQAVSGGYLDETFFKENCGHVCVQEKFMQSQDGKFFNPRMLIEVEKAKAKSQRASAASQKRWKGSDPNAEANADAINISISNSKKRDSKGGLSRGKSKPLAYPWDDELFLNRWQVWKDYRKEQHGFTYKAMGEQTALTRLQNKSDGDMSVAIEMMEQSMANGWKDWYELKQGSGISKQQQKQAFDKADQIMKEAGL